MRDEDEIHALADKAVDLSGKPTKYFSMTYEDGVREALEWVLDETIPDDEAPLT
jgi:hypothetical protein